MALEIEQDQDQAQPKRRIPTPDEVFGTKKRIPTPDEVFGVKKKATPSGYSVTPLPSQDKFDIGEEVATIGYKSPIGKAIQKDKIKGSNVAGVYNTLVGSLASISGGFTYMADILGAQPYMPLNVRVATAEADRKKAVDFIEQARSSRSSKEFEQQQSQFDITPTEGGGLMSGVDWEDVRGLAFQAPKTLLEMAAGSMSGGLTFAQQSVNDNAKELEESGEGKKLTDVQKVGYLFTQAAAQAALEKFSIDKILKNTGLAKSIEKKITAEVIEGFAQKGIKATAKEVQDEMVKKAAKISTKLKNVGIKGLESAFVEGSTEGIQQAASDAIKVATNKIAEKEVFNEEDINKNFWKNVVNNAIMGAAMGGATGAGLQGLNSTDKAIRQQVANATGEKKFYVDDKEVTENEFNQSTGNKKVTTDLQNIQDQINKQVEEGNITPEEAQAANITAQQYVEIAEKIPTTVSPEDKYKIIGGISQRNSLQQDLQNAREEMMQVDPIFRKEKQDQIDLIQAKIDETGDYLEGLATGKKPRYVKRDGKKGEETTYYKVDENGDKTPISQARYDLAKAIKKEDSRKKAPVDENRRRRVEQFDILYGVKSNNPEFDFPNSFEEFNKKIDSDPNYLPDLYKRAQKYKETGEIAENEMGTEASFIEAINPPVEKDITIAEVVDKKGTYKGQKGTFLQDGDSIVFENETSGEKYEIGKASEIQEKPASEFDVKYDESLVSVDDKGNINVRQKPYINRYSNPLKAINKDENGNIVSVNLETADGKKRTFKGSIAEDIAYQINLKEKSKNEPKAEVETTVVEEPMQAIENVEPVVEVKEEVEPVEVVEIPLDLEEKGEPIGSTLEAERRRSNGERIFAVTEQDEEPVEVTSVEMLRSYTPDQLLAYKPTEVAEETKPVEIPKEVYNPIVDKIRKGIQKLSDKAKISVLKGKNFAKALEDAIKTGGANLQSWGGFEKKGFEESPQWKKLIDDGTVKLNFDIKGLEGKPVVVINPDNMLTGEVITKNGKPIVDGNGGINFVTKFGDVWASSDNATANTLAKYINEARQKDIDAGGNGTIHVVVTKGDLSKSLTSHTGAKAAMKVLEYFVDKKLVSLSDFRKALTEVGKKYNIDFDGRLDAKAIHDDISKKFFGVNDSTFSKRGFFVQDIIDHLAKNSKSAKENIGKIRELLNTEALPQSTERKTGEISFAKEGIIDAIGHLLSDNMTVGVKNSEAYATIEIKHPVKVVDLSGKEEGHESYPFHLQQFDENGNKVKPVLNVLKESQHVTDILNDANNNAVDKKGGAGKFGSNQIGMAKGVVKPASEHPSNVNMMTDATGTIYGFEQNGKIVLNADVMNGNTPFHEAGHLWLSWAKENREDLHDAGMAKIEGSKYLSDVKNNPVYQENASKLPELERENYFKSEALAKAIGDNGEKFVTAAQKADFKQWLKDLWDTIAIHFGIRNMTAEQISNMTLDEFSKKVVADIVSQEEQIAAVDKLKGIKSFKNKKNFIKDNLKNEEDKKAIDELDFTEQDLIEIAKSEFDLPTFKNIKDAVQERSTEKILQPKQGEDGESGGGRKRMEPRVEGETTTEEGAGTEATQPESTTEIPEEIENVGLDNGDVDYVRITAADIGELRKSLGLPPYKGLPLETHEMLREAAQEMIKKGVSVESLYDKIKLGKILTNYENAFMAEYRAALDLELKNNPSAELLAKITEFANIFQQSASQTGKALESLKIIKKLNEANTLSNFLLSRQEDKGYPLTPKMMIEETAKFEKIQEAKEQLKESVDNDIKEQLKAEVEMESKKEDKTKTKKSHEEFVKERKDALAAAKEAVKKVNKGGGGLMASAPGLPQLFAVAPHMNKYVKSLFAEGVSKLDDIVTEVHKEFSELVEGLTKRDVLDVIAGKYNLKKKTANDINAGIRMLRREAELLGLLEKARLGQEEAKSEAQIQEKGKRIQELEAKIKEVKRLYKAKELAEEGVTEAFKENLTDTEYNEKRQKFLDKKITELKNDLKNKNYDKEAKEITKYTISKKTKQKMDEVIELEKALAVERYKEQYSKLNKWQKAWETVKNITGIRRIVQTSIDASIWFRQLAKLTLNPRKWDIAAKFIYAGSQSIFSQKNYDRLMYGIEQSPDFKNMTKDGIRFNDINAKDSKNINEFTNPKSIVYKIPVIRNLMISSQRIADASMNVARYELYQKYQKVLLSKGITRESDPKVYEGMAKWVMNSTGSGNMLKFLESKAGQEIAGTLFYGARLMAANFNTLNLAYYVKMPSEVREMAWKDMAAYTSTVIMSTLALAAAGGTVSMDPDDPEFLQVRFGKKVYDLTAGQAPYIRTFLRIMEAFGATGSQVLGYTSKFEAGKSRDFASNSVINFFRNKLSPNYSYAVNAYVGKNTIGQDFNPMEVFQIYPMYADDVYDAVKEDGMVSLLTVLMPNILGVGFGSYYSDKNMKPMEEMIQRAQNSDELDPKSIREDITMSEFKEFAKLRDKLIEEKMKELYEEGIYDAEAGEYVPIKKSTPENITAAIMKAKSAATKEAKSEFNADEEE